MNKEVYQVKYTKEVRFVEGEYIQIECDNLITFSRDTIWFNHYPLKVEYFNTEGKNTVYRVREDVMILNHRTGSLDVHKKDNKLPHIYYRR